MDEQPTVGTWYETDEGDVFAVLAVDTKNGVVDVRYLNGKLDQFDRESWQEAEMTEVETPEEWRGSMDEFLAGRRRK